ncbi:MAG TPA: hypothetical protein VLK37_11010 [Solirubrobacterales bacterium]|nr:hypothetical protein [Solirubrobacterales bacterium]
MRHAEQNAKSAARSKVGIFAVPSRFSGVEGSGAPSRRLRIALAALALLAVAALGAGTASGADPTVTVDPVATHAITTAHATGTITTDSEANGGAETNYYFQFRQVKPVGEEEEWGFGPQGTVPAETTAQAIEGDIGGLKANTAYEVRLAAFPVNGGESYSAPSAPFTTDPATNAPVLALDPVVPFYTSAQLSGTVDPEGGNLNSPGNPVPIHWTIEISETGDPGTWSPVAEGDIAEAEAEGTAPLAVAAELTGLAPDATYHYLYRLRAAYAGLEVETSPAAATFTTEAVAKPTVTLDPIAAHGDTTATFSGEVDTNAPAVLNPQAEAAFKAEWHISCTPACPNLAPAGGAGSVEAAEGAKAISVDATGLEPNTPYEITLEASNAGGAESNTKAFATTLVAPSVNPGPGRSDGKGGYHLEAALNPHNSAIANCVFEYGPSAAYGQSIPCDSKPGAVNKTVFVTAHVTGLTLGQTYHFRITAANGAGPTTSADATFVPTESCPNEARREEQDSGFLPDCRAYEMVTPPFKQGFAPLKPAYGDDAVAYYSTGSFDGNAYGGLGNQYVARRSETGWKSIAMNPPGEEWVFFISPEGNQSGFSSDLRSVLWLMRPRTEGLGERDFDHPERDGVYVRRPDGTFSLIAPNPGTAHPRVLASTPDLSHVVLGEDPGYGGGPNAYEVIGGDQVLRPIGVDNTGAPLPGVGTSNGGPCVQGISADGRVIFFGVGAQFGCFKARARVGGTTTIEMSASQCTRGAGDPGGVCNAEAPVNPVGFARDGSRAFMTTTQQLVNGDTDEGNDLYACDIPAGAIAAEGALNKCPNLRQLTTGAADGAELEGVARISADGSHVYFVAEGVLAANHGANDETAVAGTHNLYVWETDAEHPDGHIAFLARITTLSDVVANASTQTTPDGRYLVVNTADPLVSSGAGADTDSAFDVYRYDSQTGEWLRLSTDATGSGGNAEKGTLDGTSGRNAMTDDGQTVVFVTEEALAPADGNSDWDVYAWHEGEVSLISPDGVDSQYYGSAGITASGTDIFFSTTSRVTAADTDTNFDVYTARIGGGFELREPEPPCEGKACKGPATTPPSSSAPASGGLLGRGNVKEKPRKCPKGKRKVRGKAGRSRCVPKRSGSRHGKRHQSAGGNGGAHK